MAESIQQNSTTSNAKDATSSDTYGISSFFTVRSVEFPKQKAINSNGNDVQRHYVRFNINIDEESRLVKDKSMIIGDKDRSGQNIHAKADPELVGAAIGGSMAAGSGVAKVMLGRISSFAGKAATAGGLAVAGAVVGAYAAEKFLVMKKLKRLAASITLYTPATVTSSYRIQYSEYDDATMDMMDTDRLKDLGSAKQSQASGAFKGMRTVLTNSSELVQAVTRTVRNPRKDLLFKGVDFRTFVFDFQFMPKNAEEAYEIANIIYMFKYFAHPELLEGYAQFLYIYPAQFDIEYLFDDGTGLSSNQYVNQISSCVLEGINVNYSSNGNFQSLEMGQPVQTNLTLTFKEVETLHQDRIAKGL